MFTFLLIVQAVVAAVLVTLILMQRSEGGGLGVGGSSSGLMTARGQADFLTRATAITAAAFVLLCILLAGLATQQRAGQAIQSVQPATEAPAPGIPGMAPPAQPQQAPANDSAQTAPEPVDNDVLSTITGANDSSSNGSNDDNR